MQLAVWFNCLAGCYQQLAGLQNEGLPRPVTSCLCKSHKVTGLPVFALRVGKQVNAGAIHLLIFKEPPNSESHYTHLADYYKNYLRTILN